MAAGRPAADQLIFPGHDGSHRTKTTWDNWRERTFARLLASVGLVGAVPYDLRHSFASLLLHEGRSVHYVARQLGHSPPADPGDLRARDRRARPRAEARRGRRDHAGAQRPASGASGPDRIVGVMSASGSYDTMSSNGGRGATTGPPACPFQSPPVPFRCAPSRGFAGIKSRVGTTGGDKSFSDKEEVPGSSPGSPTLRKYLQSKVFAEIAPHRRAPLELAFGCNMGASGFSGRIPGALDRVTAPRRDTNVAPSQLVGRGRALS